MNKQNLFYLFSLDHLNLIPIDKDFFFFNLQILSKNYQLGRLHQPFSRLKSLELRTVFKKHNLPGLAHLFRNSPHVETLVIIIVDLNVGRRVSQVSDLRSNRKIGHFGTRKFH